MMLHHVIELRFVEGTTEQQIEEMAAGLRDLKDRIGSIRSMRMGRDLRIREDNFHFASLIEFDDEAGYLEFRDHPAHQRVVRELIRPITAERAGVLFPGSGNDEPPEQRATGQVAADLVAANRILVRQGVLDSFGHVSVRTGEASFLMSRNLAPGSVTEADLLEHDLEGNVNDPRRPYLERFIHAEIYRRRPDVMAVVHSHSPAVVPFSTVEQPLRPVIHMAGFLDARATPVFEIADVAGDATDLLITSSELGAALATTLGDSPVALMRGHGSVAVGTTLREAVFRAVYTEINAHAQASAIALGNPRYLTPGEATKAQETVGGQDVRAWDVWCEQVASPVAAGGATP